MVASERSSKTIRRPLRAVSVKEKAHADHASQVLARLLILPTPRPCAFAPSVTTPLYRTSISKVLRQMLRNLFLARVSRFKIHLSQEQAMYACVLETGCRFFEGGCALSDQACISSDPPPPCRSWIASCQYCPRLSRFVPLISGNVYSRSNILGLATS